MDFVNAALSESDNFIQANVEVPQDCNEGEGLHGERAKVDGVSDRIGSQAALIRYTKDELLALQVHTEDSLEEWNRIAAGIGPVVEELNSLEFSNENGKRPKHRNVDRRQRSSCRSQITPEKLWLEASGDSKQHHNDEELSSTGTYNEPVGKHQAVEEEEDIYEDSDDEESLQPLAFLVDGEPDFEAGPPQDGFEYLRRVMWEAAQCPKVKTAKIDPKKLVSKQTVYMPEIPSVPVCSYELLPSKDWRKVFLADFSDLRVALSNGLLSQDLIVKALPPLRNEEVWESYCFHRTNCLGIAEPLTDEEDHMTSKDIPKDTHASSTEEASANENDWETAHFPLLRIVMSLDEVSRATLFRYHVSWLKEKETLSYERALWLFALAAAVDKPLDDQTSAAFRALLRRCAELRLDKKPGDEELHMLNILITIAGDYFGQADDSNIGILLKACP